jgi:hypothetical protein
LEVRVREQFDWAAHVCPHHDAQVANCQQRLAMGDDDRVVVNVSDPDARTDLAGNLVHGALRGQPHANVQELGNAGLGRQKPDHPAQESPVLLHRPAQSGYQREYLLRRFPVGGDLCVPVTTSA